MPGAVLNALINTSTTVGGRYYSHFIGIVNEENEAERKEIISPSSESK